MGYMGQAVASIRSLGAAAGLIWSRGGGRDGIGAGPGAEGAARGGGGVDPEQGEELGAGGERQFGAVGGSRGQRRQSSAEGGAWGGGGARSRAEAMVSYREQGS